MKKYYINNCIITKLDETLKKQYDAKYIITINHDIIGFTNNLKDAKKITKEF